MLKFLALNIYDFMKKLVFDPQPRQNYPFKKMSMNPEIQGNVKFPSSDKSMQEFVRGAFSERKGYSGNAYFAESQQVREHLKDVLVRRGYDVDEQILSDHLLSLGAGGVCVTDIWTLDPFDENPNQRGILINTEFGNIEAAHVHLLIDVIKRAVNESTGWILDVGCGPIVDQKRNLENLGIERIIYADKNSQYLEKIKRGLYECGRPDVQRRFLTIDKAELEKEIDPNTVRAVIRAGVFMLDEKEARSLRTVGTDDIEMCIFNGYDNNPLEQFLEVAEDYFENVEVHLGYDRYALRLSV